MQWFLLAGAIVAEVCGTLCLRMGSTTGRRGWFLGVAGAYGVAFVCLTLVLNEGLGVGVAYGIWAASGVALTAVASRIFFKEALTAVMMAGIVLIAAGVLVVELGANH